MQTRIDAVLAVLRIRNQQGMDALRLPQSMRHCVSLVGIILGVSVATLMTSQSALAQTQQPPRVDEPIPIDFEGLAVGEAITEIAAAGITITISTTGGIDEAWIFDSGTPTGGDEDLGTPNQACTPSGPGIGDAGGPGGLGENCEALGNILVIQENDDGIPDDAGTGGSMKFTFSEPVVLNYIDLLDFEEETKPSIAFYGEDGNVVGPLIYPIGLGDNSFERLVPEGEGFTDIISAFIIELPISGAIGGFEIIRPISRGTAPTSVELMDEPTPMTYLYVPLLQ